MSKYLNQLRNLHILSKKHFFLFWKILKVICINCTIRIRILSFLSLIKKMYYIYISKRYVIKTEFLTERTTFYLFRDLSFYLCVSCTAYVRIFGSPYTIIFYFADKLVALIRPRTELPAFKLFSSSWRTVAYGILHCDHIFFLSRGSNVLSAFH